MYDFGDHWEHTVRCGGVVESDERFHRRLLGGARAFPPEDEAPVAPRAALATAAERVELLARLRVFTTWAGGGRKLNRVFRTKSTVELA